MANVRILKRKVLEQAGVNPDGGYAPFCMKSPNHRAFWQKLERLWVDRGINPDTCNDVDEATTLTQVEYDGYLQQAAALTA